MPYMFLNRQGGQWVEAGTAPNKAAAKTLFAGLTLIDKDPANWRVVETAAEFAPVAEAGMPDWVIRP